MNCFCGLVDQRKALTLISSWNNCGGVSLSQTSDMPQAGFESLPTLSSDFVKWDCAVVITNTQLHDHHTIFDKLIIECNFRESYCSIHIC